jgi:transposase
MIAVPGGVKVLVATRPVDFRKGADGLAAMVREQLRHDPFSGTIFIFRSKREDRLKILAWDGSGIMLLWKWLHQGGFTWPPIPDGVVHLSASRLTMPLDGLDWTRFSPKPERRPTLVG